MTVTVCIGSSCHIKGSREVISELQRLMEENGLRDVIELAGSFCMDRCRDGVCVDIDGEAFSVSPDKVDEFFKENILKRLK